MILARGGEHKSRAETCAERGRDWELVVDKGSGRREADGRREVTLGEGGRGGGEQGGMGGGEQGGMGGVRGERAVAMRQQICGHPGRGCTARGYCGVGAC